jgi:hypothetical protein
MWLSVEIHTEAEVTVQKKELTETYNKMAAVQVDQINPWFSL